MNSCKKTKIAYFEDNAIYTNDIQVQDATFDYDNPTGQGKGLLVNDENGNPFFFQTNLNSSLKEAIQTLIDAFTISTPPTSAYEIALDTNLKAAKTKLEQILEIIP